MVSQIVEIYGIYQSPKLIVGKEGELKRWNEVEEGGCEQNLPREGALVLNRIPHRQSSAENIDPIAVGMCHNFSPFGIRIWSRLKVPFSPEGKVLRVGRLEI